MVHKCETRGFSGWSFQYAQEKLIAWDDSYG